jgi:hypothetical protein
MDNLLLLLIGLAIFCGLLALAEIAAVWFGWD